VEHFSVVTKQGKEKKNQGNSIAEAVEAVVEKVALGSYGVFIYLLDYFPCVARVFIYPNLIVICVPSLVDNFYAPWRYITNSSADLHTVTYSH
jgi:hypothetical protein